jgi:hypothetical protein
MHGVLPPIPNMSSWPGSKLKSTGTTSPLGTGIAQWYSAGLQGG